MQEPDVIGRIKQLCQARSWSYYKLAKESGITYSTLNTLLRKTYCPAVPTLCRICDGFGITLEQFFSDEKDPFSVTAEQREHLVRWEQLSKKEKDLAEAYMQALIDAKKP